MVATTYDLAWGVEDDAGGFQEASHCVIKTSMALDNEVYRLGPVGQAPMQLRVYETYIDANGLTQRGDLVRAYLPDAEGLTWVPIMETADPKIPWREIGRQLHVCETHLATQEAIQKGE